jgi:hypothetical protein
MYADTLQLLTTMRCNAFLLLTAGRTHQEIQRIINAPTASKLRNTGMQYVVVEGVSYN